MLGLCWNALLMDDRNMGSELAPDSRLPERRFIVSRSITRCFRGPLGCLLGLAALVFLLVMMLKGRGAFRNDPYLYYALLATIVVLCAVNLAFLGLMLKVARGVGRRRVVVDTWTGQVTFEYFVFYRGFWHLCRHPKQVFAAEDLTSRTKRTLDGWPPALEVMTPVGRLFFGPDMTGFHEVALYFSPDCPRCGYSLKGIRAGVCPECGYTVLLARRPTPHTPIPEAPRRSLAWASDHSPRNSGERRGTGGEGGQEAKGDITRFRGKRGHHSF
jgi:hypothetical protein